MAEFIVPDINVSFDPGVDIAKTSNNELPFIPFSSNEDELGFVSFN